MVAFIDSFALVIECKSGKVTPPALRGAPDRLHKHIKDLLIDPNLQPATSPLFSSSFSQLEQRNPARWTEIGVGLNMFSPDDQNRITKRLAKLEKMVHKNWRTPKHKNMLIYVPSKASSYALAYVMVKGGNFGERWHFMEDAAATALKSEHVQMVIVVPKNIDGDGAAYDAIALYED